MRVEGRSRLHGPRHGRNAAPDGDAACPGDVLRPARRSRIGICGCRRFVLYGPPWSCFDTLAATPAGATQRARRFDTPGIPVLPTSWIRRPGREANIHWGSSRPDDGGGHPSPDLSGPAVRSTRQRWQDVDAPLQKAERAEVRTFARASWQRALAEGPGACRGMSVARKLCGAASGIGFRVQSEPEPAGSGRGAPVVDEERESL